jgi:anti-sigma regulatory factor (Ser/Thr protein kinase)
MAPLPRRQVVGARPAGLVTGHVTVSHSQSGYCYARWVGVETGRSLDLDLPAVPASCSHARHAVREALTGAAVDIAAVDLAVTEAVTNVVVHAYRDRAAADGPGRVRVAVTIRDEAAWIVVADQGVGMAPRPDSPGLGMGLSLIAGVCAGLDIEQRHDGTWVHMRFALDAAARGPEPERRRTHG